MSSHQLHPTLGCTVKTAGFVSHRLREAMRQGELAVPFGSGGGAVETDETFIGREPGMPKKRAYHHKMKVLRKGVYQHCGKRHLHRYLAEFDFRYNHRQRLGIDDVSRLSQAILGARGKRLTYRDSFA